MAERVKTYGRAFGDPDKGSEVSALSDRQAVKLKQISKKVKAERAKAAAEAEPEPGG